MKKVLIWSLFLLMSALSSAAFANEGGVGSGGGGTTNPNPADPEWVVSAAHEYGAKVITSWLRKEEGRFQSLSPEEQAKSIFAKFFLAENGKSIYQVIASTEVEYRMHQPCADAEGHPSDGSIYGTHPGSICLSPFRMAPKLNDFDVQAETIALLVHEFGHVMGMNEAEAVAVQKDALYSFMHMDMLDVVVAIDLLAGPHFGSPGANDIAMLETKVGGARESLRSNMANYNSFDDIQHGLSDLRAKVNEHFRALSFLSPRSVRLITANAGRVISVAEISCAFMEQEKSGWSTICRDAMERGFAGKEKVSVADYLAGSIGGDKSNYGEESNEIELTRPGSQRDLTPQMDELLAFLRAVQTELNSLRDLQLKGYRTN